MMRILVTGGAGFIGSNFIRYVLGKNKSCEIVNLDKLSYAGNPENMKDFEGNPNYTFIKGDICDHDTVEKAMDGCDYVVNFAAESHVDRSIHSADEFIRTNILGTNILLEKARMKGVVKFIQISTDEVYGSIDNGSFTESSTLVTNSPYSASKAAAEHMCRAYYVTFGLPVVITRSSNNFGPYQYPEKFVALSITNLLEDKKVPLYGDGKNVRDWLFVEDNCDGIYFVLNKGTAGEVYNIAGGYEMMNIEMVRAILKAMAKDVSMVEYVKDRLGHDRRYSLDDSKLRAMGWKPGHTFASALEKTVKWYEGNRDWWMKIKHKDTYKSYYKKQYK
ncbi:MAG TPA: dTDP-glucose 4,6-dehydratase [Candidatus Omnitrophota bacterium]|nr:dTDP-glucose 4,6-dehydratase [Candidatus Omnitrophota bacterium]